MNPIKNIIAIALVWGCFAITESYSQDDRLPDLDSGSKEIRTENSSEYYEGDSKIIKPTIIYRDTVQVKSAPKKTEKSKTDESKSILSFNFLYYLIERYKLADIVD